MNILGHDGRPAGGPAGGRDGDTLDAEMRRLERRYRGVAHLFRTQVLVQRLERCGIDVVASSTGFCGDRISLLLDHDWLLKLWLYWPRRSQFTRLESIRWTERAGWVVDLLDREDERVRCYAWKITVPSVGR